MLKPGYVRVQIDFSPDVAAVLDCVRRDEGLTRTAVLRKALGVYHTMRQETKAGHYVGVATDRGALDGVLLTPL
jgi:hypothetical protein